MSDIPPEVRDAARDAARPYAADIAEDVITHIARSPGACDVGAIIGEGLAKAVSDALSAATPAIRADERAKLQPAIDRVATLAEAAQENAVAAAVAAERERLRQAAADMQASVYDRDQDEWTPLADLMTDLPPADRERSEAEAEFIAASVAVWREIDRINANPGGYHPTKMSMELRDRERAAWNRYRDLLEPAP